MREDDALRLLDELNDFELEFFACLSLRTVGFDEVLRRGKAFAAFVQRDDGSVKPSAEITGGYIDDYEDVGYLLSIKYQIKPIYLEYIKDGMINPSGKEKFETIVNSWRKAEF